MAGWLIHIGYAKAASTYLQSTVLSGAHPSFRPFEPRNQNQGAYHKPGRNLFLNRVAGQTGYVPFAFDADAVRATLVQSANPDPNAVTVLSSEDLAGHPYSGGVWAEGVAARIAATVPDARILIVIREQRKMLLSAYSDYLERMGGLSRLEHFLHPNAIDQIPSHIPQFYDFAPLVEHYQTLFGADRVLVLPMEVLVRHPSDTVDRLCAFCDVPTAQDWQSVDPVRNARDYRTYAALRRARRSNIWSNPRSTNGHAGRGVVVLRSLIRGIAKLMTTQAAADRIVQADMARIEAALRPVVAPGNARLQAFVEDDLSALDYMMP